MSASDVVPNLIDEVGAFQTGFDPLGQGKFLLAAITFDAHTAGIATFASDPADVSPLHDVLLYEPDDQPVGLSAITLGAKSITIGTPIAEGELAYTNPINPLDVNADSNVTPMDALAVVNALNSMGPARLPAVVIYAGEGEMSSLLAKKPHIGYVDVNGDGFISPIDALQIVNRLNAKQEALAEGELAASTLSLAAAADQASSATWIVGPYGMESTATSGELPEVATPDAVLSSNSDTSDYLTAREANGLWAEWDGDSSATDADVTDDLAAAIATIWDGPSTTL